MKINYECDKFFEWHNFRFNFQNSCETEHIFQFLAFVNNLFWQDLSIFYKCYLYQVCFTRIGNLYVLL